MSKVSLAYIPHGVDHNVFYKLTEPEDLKRASELRKQMFGDDNVEFVVLFNNRNIRRKMVGDVILAFQRFYHKLTTEQQSTVRLVLHTTPVDENGTDLVRLINDLAPEIPVVFSAQRVEAKVLNDIYNNSDVVINLASNEGFGLSTLEAIMAERMIIANVTGGLQDQMGFHVKEGDEIIYLHEDVHYNKEWGTNHDGKYRNHGEWVVPVFPNNHAINGSPPTPYIFDDRCDWREAADAIFTVYQMGPEERARRGALGREYATTQGFSSDMMSQSFVNHITKILGEWKPRDRFEMFKV